MRVFLFEIKLNICAGLLTGDLGLWMNLDF